MIESVVVLADPGLYDPVEVIFFLSGEIDMSTAPCLVERADALAISSPTVVLLDVRAVTFIDVFSLGTLCALQRRLRDGGHDLLLRSPSPQVRWVLSLTHLTQQLASDPGGAS